MIRSPKDLVDFYCGVAKRYPIKLMEDPFDENAFDTHAELTAEVGDAIEL